MSRIRGKNTIPEIAVRRLLHRLGYRFRLHRRDLPGNPDIVFPGRWKVIFVHGCFWHRHSRCTNCTTPRTRPEFWIPKLEGNAARDQRNQKALHELGWEYLVVWECEVTNTDELHRRLVEFLEK